MAKAGVKHTPPSWEWILVGVLLERKSAAVRSPRLADKIMRRELHEGRRPFRYLDGNGVAHAGKDLVRNFWPEAVVNRAESSAKRPATRTRPGFEPAWFPRHAVENLRAIDRAMGRPPPPPPPLYPVVEIFRIEVLVPVSHEQVLASEPESSQLDSESTVEKQARQPDPSRTGSAGRPTAAHIVLEKARNLISNGAVKPKRGGLKHFTTQLEGWWEKERKKSNPPGPPMKAGSIENAIRDLWQSSINTSA